MPRLRSSASYNNYTPKPAEDFASKHHRPFFIILVVITLTCLILVLSACAVFAYYRIRYGPLKIDRLFSPECPSNQVWSDCGYACNLTCAQPLAVCAAVCKPRCECPGHLSLWHDGKCISLDQCPLSVNSTMSVNEFQYSEKVPDVMNSDSLLEGKNFDKLSEFMQKIWTLDDKRFHGSNLKCNLQGKTNLSMSVDVSPTGLFTENKYEDFRGSASYSSFIELLGYFKKNIKEADPMNDGKLRAINYFLDTILRGNIMKETEQFLKEHGLIASDTTYRDLLYNIWFEPYPKSPKYNTTDSSGFEHVFVGEVRGRKISGLNNWIQFYVLEKFQNLNYYGYLGELYSPQANQIIALNVKYVWGNHRRRQGSFTVSTSPDFDLAMYTVCFILNPNRPCKFHLEDLEMDIQTWDVKHVPGWQIGGAYPVV